LQVLNYPALAPYQERYAGLETVPLKVTLWLRPGAGLCYYDPLNLDNLLARLVVDEATQGQGLPHEPTGCYRLPVPLKALWHSPEGLPLYACTPLLPVGFVAGDTQYFHKRAQSCRWTCGLKGVFRLATNKGRWMERRIPIRVQVCEEWAALAVGNPQEIARLLAGVTAIGKHRNRGQGEVNLAAPAEVSPAEGFDLVSGGMLTRRVPVGAMHLLPGVPEETPGLVGWTPPQWKSALWQPGWREGVAVA